ncbi:MAG: hypothetical protein NT136_02425 [Candidatus Moranbacteria bacterium]|nr:hypothetical protein [Candidatus Moranbacteria bacterium]
MTALIILIAILIIIVLLLVDFFMSGTNPFIEKWLRRILWVWLPFYALYNLTRELILRMSNETKRTIK